MGMMLRRHAEAEAQPAPGNGTAAPETSPAKEEKPANVKQTRKRK